MRGSCCAVVAVLVAQRLAGGSAVLGGPFSPLEPIPPAHWGDSSTFPESS
jgi:hypothetical protein